MLNGNHFDDYCNANRRIVSVIYRKGQHAKNIWCDSYDFGDNRLGWFGVEVVKKCLFATALVEVRRRTPVFTRGSRVVVGNLGQI